MPRQDFSTHPLPGRGLSDIKLDALAAVEEGGRQRVRLFAPMMHRQPDKVVRRFFQERPPNGSPQTAIGAGYQDVPRAHFEARGIVPGIGQIST
jgi:hypothetical protein